jgi:HD-GYP domain-containing protein (c-di-GMP phosphodiesterase class II)
MIRERFEPLAFLGDPDSGMAFIRETEETLVMPEATVFECPIGRQGGGSSLDLISPWVALDRFIRELEYGQQVSPFSAGLMAICESTNARLAFIYADSVGRATAMIGAESPSPQWCRDLTHRLTAAFPKGGCWQAGRDESPWSRHLPAGPVPCSAVLLPVEAPCPSWIVAISFDPGSPLTEGDLGIVRVIWRLQAGHNRHVRVYENLKETLFGIVRCLSTAIDAKDTYTCGHSERVARIAVRLGEVMNLARGEISDLYLAGLLHDVGKIGIRDEVLLKPGPLTSVEEKHLREHPIIGERIISNVTRLAYLRPAVRGHHERYDGKGYPDGLAGEGIPPIARIIAVADSCDAMMSPRRYRPALASDQIEAIFREHAGTQWDPSIVQCFFACRHDLYAVCQRGLGQSVYMALERAAGVDAAVPLLPFASMAEPRD